MNTLTGKVTPLRQFLMDGEPKFTHGLPEIICEDREKSVSMCHNNYLYHFATYNSLP
jgi:hypothetical protein